MTLFLSLFPSLTINTPTHPSALHTTLLFSPIPNKPLFLSSPSSHPTTPLLPQNGHQKIKQTASSSHSEANSQEVLKLRKETTRLRWTRPSFGRPKGPFCCICWRKQKQKHCPNLLLDSPWVPNPSAAGRRRIWLQPRDGYHNPLRRRSFSVSNIHAQMKIRQAAVELVFFFFFLLRKWLKMKLLPLLLCSDFLYIIFFFTYILRGSYLDSDPKKTHEYYCVYLGLDL